MLRPVLARLCTLYEAQALHSVQDLVLLNLALDDAEEGRQRLLNRVRDRHGHR